MTKTLFSSSCLTKLPREKSIPTDTRYIPIPQQPYCCVPACLSMVLLRRGLPLLPQELIGHRLGLVVPTGQKKDFWNPCHAKTPPTKAGFGTQIRDTKQFGVQKFFDDLCIPLQFHFISIDEIANSKDLATRLKKHIASNDDVLICLNWGALTGLPEKNWGHIMCVDQVQKSKVRLMDTDVGAKWKSFSLASLFKAMSFHGSQRSGGLWVLTARSFGRPPRRNLSKI